MSQMFWHKLLCWFIGSGWLEQRQVPCRQQCDSLRFNSSSVQAEIFWAQVAANLASTEQQIMAVFCINPLSYLFFLPGWSSQCFSDFPELLRCTWTQALTCEQGFRPSGTIYEALRISRNKDHKSDQSWWMPYSSSFLILLSCQLWRVLK